MKKEETKKYSDNSFGTASVILGIIGLVISSLPGAIFGAVGLIFASKQRKISKNGWSKAGKILNVIAIILGLTLFVVNIIYLLKDPTFMAQFQGQLANAQ